ncbi:MAG: AsmA family protein [Desulfovibrio desulfuricans]|nr:AsmA family protein [Desulfovibrio desulfuricans]
MKRIALWMLGIVAGLVVAAAVLLSRVDAEFVVNRIAEATAAATGRPLRFSEPPRISFFPPGVRFGQAVWGDPAAGRGMALSVRSGMAQLELAPLLSGSVVVREVRLDGPALELRPSGEAENAAASPAAGAVNDAPQPLPDALPLELKRLVLRQGSVRYVDAAGRVLRADDVNLSVENLRDGAEAAAQCDFSFALQEPAANGAVRATTGTMALSSRLRYARGALAFRQTSLTLTPLSGRLSGKAGPMQLSCEGELRLEGLRLRLDKAWLATPQARLGLAGEGSLQPPAFAGSVELEGSPRRLAALFGHPLKAAPRDVRDELRLKSLLRYAPDTGLRLDRLDMRLDGISLQGELGVRPRDNGPLAVTGEMRVGSIRLDDYLPLPGTPDAPGKDAGPAAPAAGARAAGASGGRAAHGGATGLPEVDMRLAVAEVRRGGLSVKDMAARVRGRDGHYALEGFSCRLSGGTVKAAGSLDVPAQTCAVRGVASDILLGPLLEALGKTRAADGVIGLDADLTMRCSDPDAVRASLAGRGTVTIRRLHVPALAALSGASALAGKSLPDRFDSVRAPFAARKGIVDAAPVTVTSSGLKGAGKARVSLPGNRLDAVMNVTTLGMTIPVTAHGPLDNIAFGVDPRFALDMAKALPGVLPDAGRSAGQGAAGGAGSLLDQGARGAGDLIRGILGR